MEGRRKERRDCGGYHQQAAAEQASQKERERRGIVRDGKGLFLSLSLSSSLFPSLSLSFSFGQRLSQARRASYRASRRASERARLAKCSESKERIGHERRTNEKEKERERKEKERKKERKKEREGGERELSFPHTFFLPLCIAGCCQKPALYDQRAHNQTTFMQKRKTKNTRKK